MSFSSVNYGEKGPYTHTLTSKTQLVFVVLGTFWSKTQCLAAKLDTLTSKKSGRFQKLLYIFLSQNRVFKSFFYGQKHIQNTYTYTHSHTLTGHSGEYGKGAKLVGKISKSVMQLITIHF